MESPTDGFQYRSKKCFIHQATRLEEELKFKELSLKNRECSRDVTAAMLVSPTNPPGIEL